MPLKLIPRKMVLPILQGELRGKKWIAGSSDHGCWLGSYEYEKQKLFSQSLSAGNVVFDIGAHVGFYTLLALNRVGKKGKVISFEPTPGNLDYLYQHLRLNRAENAEVVEAAVSDVNGKAWFKRGESSSTGSLSEAGDFEVRTVALDTMIAAREIPVPDLIKMDIEGGEFLALTGARKLLIEHHPVIFLATHGPAVHARCCDFLSSIGYKLKAITGSDLASADEIIAT